jgi:hypothetical protein
MSINEKDYLYRTLKQKIRHPMLQLEPWWNYKTTDVWVDTKEMHKIRIFCNVASIVFNFEFIYDKGSYNKWF